MTAILHVLNDVERAGNGIINATVDLACEQRARGHRVSVASAGGAYVDLLDEHGVSHTALAGIRRPERLLRSALALRSFVRDGEFDIVHVHMNYTTLVARLAVVGTPARLVATAHTSFKIEAGLMGLADRVVAVSRAVAASMHRKGVPRSHIRVVRNGTLGSARAGKPRQPHVFRRPAVMSVAGMYDRKGIDVLIDAFAKISATFPQAGLHLLGDGPDRPQFERRAAATECADRICFHGFQPDPAPFLAAADIFVLPSRRDPFPLVITEAREAGCAVVASTADGIPEACDWGRAGWLFPVDDVDALAEALRTLIGDPGELARWRSAARTNLEQYHVERVAREIDQVYAELLSGR